VNSVNVQTIGALVLLLAASACVPVTPTARAARSDVMTGQLETAATFPDLSVAALQNVRLPGSIDNDRNLLLGGVGSDLWSSPADPPGEFWMVTDRGPNDEVRVDGQSRRTFPVPDYTPTILHVRLDGAAVTVLDAIPVVGQSGQPVTGLPNVPGQEEPYDYAGQARLAFNPSGLDLEGLARTPSGEFWAVDEYAPSLVRIDASGRVVRRFVPEGVQIDGADYPVTPALPAILSARTPNRGFEGLTLSPDGATLYLAIQSPLANPDGATGSRSRHARLLAFDVASEQATAEYVWQFGPTPDDAVAATPTREPQPGRVAKPKPERTPGPAPHQLRLSALAAPGPNTLLALERTSSVARLYLADLTNATSILGTRWDDPQTTPSLEALAELSAGDLAPLPKSLTVDLTSVPGLPEKIEGVTIVNATTVAVANDNDFDVGTFDASGNNVGKGVRSQILLVRLPRPLPS
jgi:Esterase-like activity of phytase